MMKRFSMRYVLLSLCLDVGLILVALYLANLLRIRLPYGLVNFDTNYPHGLLELSFYPVALGLWILMSFTTSLYDPKRVYKATEEFQVLTFTIGLFALLSAGVLYFTFRDTSRVLMLYAYALIWVFLILWRVLSRTIFRTQRKIFKNQDSRVIILGAGQLGQHVADMIQQNSDMALRFCGYLDDACTDEMKPQMLGTLSEVGAVVMTESIDDVILALPPSQQMRVNAIVSSLHTLPVNVRIVPDYLSLALYRATAEDFGGIPMINLRDPALNHYQRLVKRIFDLIIVGALTFLSMPVMGLIALAIKLDSPGPVLYRQPRVGENGRLFEMFKFRSMVVNAEDMQMQVNQVDDEGHVIHKVKDDPRVTRVGHFIRRWSLDELPQFFNVLRGDLSLIGPRPELPWLVDQYELWQRKRFAVPQGITGWWQVNGRSDKTMHLHTDEDLYYIQNYSLWLDIYILLKTPFVVLRGKGAF